MTLSLFRGKAPFPIVPAERVKKSCNGRKRVSPRLISIVSVPSFNGGGGLLEGANCKLQMQNDGSIR